jgi:hypothetical protein
MYIHVYVYVCVCIYIYIYACIHTYTHIYDTRVLSFAFSSLQIPVIPNFLHTHMPKTSVYVYTCVRVFIYIYIYIYTHTCMHTCIYVCVCTYVCINNLYNLRAGSFLSSTSRSNSVHPQAFTACSLASHNDFARPLRRADGDMARLATVCMCVCM